MAGQGWIKLHRKLLKSAAWADPTIGRVWIQLLLEANWERRQLRSGQWLEVGELIIGQEKFAKEVGTTRQKLRKALCDLEKCGNLTSQTTSRGTHLSICNWRTYQDDETENNQPNNQRTTSGQPADNQRTTIEEEVKKGRREERKKKAAVAAIPIPSELQSPHFLAVWASWRQHRKEIHKPLTPTATSRQLAKMAKWGPERAVAALEHSMGNGWTGVFEADKPSHTNSQPTLPTPRLVFDD